MSTGKTTLALLLSALLPAGAAWAAGNDTLVYCSEASPESFNPQIASSGPSFVASSQVLYNRLVSFDPVKNTPIPSLATEWHVSEDGKTFTTFKKEVNTTPTNDLLLRFKSFTFDCNKTKTRYIRFIAPNVMRGYMFIDEITVY